MTYIVERKDRFYVVAYDGLDPLTGKERRRWHPVGHDRHDAELAAARIDRDNAGAATHAEAVSWLAELADAGTTGSFFWAVTMFAVGGVRHTPIGPTCAAKEEDR